MKALDQALPFPCMWSNLPQSYQIRREPRFPVVCNPLQKKVKILKGSIPFFFFFNYPDTNRTGTQMQNKTIFILQFLSSGNQLVSLIQISSSYSSLILFNLLFQLNSIVCDLFNFPCFPASLILTNFTFVPFTSLFLVVIFWPGDMSLNKPGFSSLMLAELFPLGDAGAGVLLEWTQGCEAGKSFPPLSASTETRKKPRPAAF